jgi:hypothetical protein
MIRPRSRTVVAPVERLDPEPLTNRALVGSPLAGKPLSLDSLEAIHR